MEKLVLGFLFCCVASAAELSPVTIDTANIVDFSVFTANSGDVLAVVEYLDADSGDVHTFAFKAAEKVMRYERPLLETALQLTQIQKGDPLFEKGACQRKYLTAVLESGREINLDHAKLSDKEKLTHLFAPAYTEARSVSFGRVAVECP